ncbi:hypothetical protein PoB_004405100 [Plakobranchus ocellatus]|uniref:Uncharacterized protein n=1 Tax=Plakobranchus ocellatus TaxID=259542 RepID=A0AAV4B2G9_9GAST|nr:hypothetical protein PoB_004405100 [Plakobranchus ocellatus]
MASCKVHTAVICVLLYTIICVLEGCHHKRRIELNPKPALDEKNADCGFYDKSYPHGTEFKSNIERKCMVYICRH